MQQKQIIIAANFDNTMYQRIKVFQKSSDFLAPTVKGI